MDRVAANGHRSFLDWGNVWISCVREDDGRICFLHDYLEVDVPFAQDCGVMLGRNFHRHENRTLYVSGTLTWKRYITNIRT